MLDIRDACGLVLEFIRGHDEASFLNDRKTQSSVLHQLLVMGEAAKRVTEATRTSFPGIRWRRITGMRDRLIHGYHDVDMEEVWATAETDVAGLL